MALLALVLTGCFSTVHRPGVVERRVLDRHAPTALPARTEPLPEVWPAADAAQVASDIVVIDRAGARRVHTRSRAQRHDDSVLVDHGPGWPPNHRYPIAELQDVYVDHVIREPGLVATREVNVPVTALAVIACVGGTVLGAYLVESLFRQEGLEPQPP